MQRWLPEYPDGDLPAFWKGRLKSHLGHCPACRRELAALKEVVAAIKAAPVAEPGPEFWMEFSRDLHLKLARVAHETQQAAPETPRISLWWSRLPYLLGAPALAVLLLWVGTYITNPERPALAPPPQVAQKAAPTNGEPAQPAALAKSKAAPPPAETPRVAEAPKAERAQTPAVAQAPLGAAAEQYLYATLDDNGAWPDDDLDFPSGDLDAILAGMTDQEKEHFLKNLQQKKKDGSCLESSSFISLA
ncbi:MAG: hypothetical protein A3K23_04455 [Desulfobacca sp. RBG_16_58_9]|nr:MAG: hypothetical protein A3K23_04455 [Desulfobacca sp. RBG_16_58_9]